MKLHTFLKLSPAIYKSGKCAYLRSPPGRGKTTTIIDARQYIAREMNKNLGLVVINGPLLTPADMVGYLVPVKKDDGVVESQYTMPFWWRTTDHKRLEEYDGGIIFIDEADKMDIDCKKVAGEMSLSGRCGPHVLPPGWVVWMAGNRQGDRSGSTKELDHLINRRFEIDVTDDGKGWEIWALKNDVHPALIKFANDNPNIVFSEETPKEQGPWCTPRSLVTTGELLATLGSNGELPTDDDAVELAAAGIGPAAAAQLFATIRLDAELPDFEDVVKNPTGAKFSTAPDVQMLACYKYAQKVDASTITPVIQYIERMPADFASTFVKAAVTKTKMLAAHPAMMAWQQRNNSIMTTLAMLKQYN
jgi:hypothetical protein